jgi:hypothetical protein
MLLTTFGALALACGGSSAPAHGTDATATSDAPPTPTTTIAAAREAYGGTGTSASITVNAVVTAVQGPTGDQVIWYVEDPAGGAHSGISVFCDPLAATTCPCKASCAPHVAAPALNTLVSITGTISAYHGQLQLEPTAQTVLQTGSTPPPTYMASASDLAESATSAYQGVYVKFAGAAMVDDLVPPALYDTECNPTAGSGMPSCSGCAPPTYAGFEVNGPGSGAFFVEETFFPVVTLASSPECTSQPGAVPVTMGESFPFIAGILDVDPYAMKQVLSPVQPSDY